MLMRQEPADPIRSKTTFQKTAPAAYPLVAKLASLETAKQEETAHAAMVIPLVLLSQDLPTWQLMHKQLSKDLDISAPD